MAIPVLSTPMPRYIKNHHSSPKIYSYISSIPKAAIFICFNVTNSTRYLSWYSDWLQVGLPKGKRSSPGRVKNFHFCISFRPALGPTQPPINGYQGLFPPGVKRQGREANDLPPTSAEVKKTWIYTSTPLYVFMS
jgi:hypothetical protein